MGWTGLPSRRKLNPVINKDGITGSRGNSLVKDQDIPLIELDFTFAGTLEISDGQKVTTSLHLDPPIAQTINIEPLTAEDWEIIELHAGFLELNLVSQIRALPNPNYTSPDSTKCTTHPLTLKLTPTSTANITIISLSPELPPSVPFAKLSPDAEVIVAPKTRSKPQRSHGENRSVTSRRSTSGKKKISKEEVRPSLYLRGIDRSLCQDWFKYEEESGAHSLKVWVDRDIVLAKNYKTVKWVSVTILKPANLQSPIDSQKQQQEVEKTGVANLSASKVVAQLILWYDPPDSNHVALSESLCNSLGAYGIVGGIVKLDPAPQQMPKNSNPFSNDQESSFLKPGPKIIKIYPFSRTNRANEGLKFGGESRAEREEASRRILKTFNQQSDNVSLLDGPLTDGMVLGKLINPPPWPGWEGGLLRFDHTPSESRKQICHWFLGSEHKFIIEIQAEVPFEPSISEINNVADLLPPEVPSLVGIDDLINQLQDHLLHMSSALLTGAQGSGKSSLAQFLVHRLRRHNLFHTTYFSCQKIITNETRISTIKDNFDRLFLSASWGAKLGGRSLVVLDDLDKLCPAETELDTTENGRSRQISEGLCLIVKKYCSMDSGVVLIATAESKESVHNVIVGKHIFRESFALKAPNKEARRRVFEFIATKNLCFPNPEARPGLSNQWETRSLTPASVQNGGNGDWMESDGEMLQNESSKPNSGGGFVVTPDLDFLDLASETDGYMPGDIVLLVARARSEAVIRAISEDSISTNNIIQIGREDFTRAIEGFTPASLRNVSLQRSTTTFDCIGGLHTPRKILLETLQYPTTYAPIFAHCPLRLRSGILLYGYPGCGKTLLASVVAGEFGLNFISVKGPEILNKYIGASEKSVRDLFERAQAAKPCILFFDEFDSIAPKRGHDSTGVTDRVVNQILTQMDGAEGLSGVYVLAATSRPDLIDPALLRPGRLDKSLICELPNEEDRIDILSALGKKLKLSEDAKKNLPEIASHTEGYSGADLQALIYNAHLAAIHDLLDGQDEGAAGRMTNGTKRKTLASTKNFIQFRYGEEEERLEVESQTRFGTNRAKILSERLAISTKLAEIRKHSKQKLTSVTKDFEQLSSKEHNAKGEALIEWKHLAKSLSTTKASISADERERLTAIYREFLTARDGEVKSGDGGREIGGRVSLM